ncbi:MAG TPA: hypothetical protein VNZ61_08655 [Roseomonas sp.]|nr:hypothetical protein [Roseomonas sp.]
MGALIAAALGLAPELIRLLAGDKAAGVATAAAEAIAGTSDPDKIKNLPPDQQAELRKALAQIALQQLQAEYADRASARQVGAQNKLIAWAQVTGAAIVLGIWGAMALRLAFNGLPAGNEVVFSTLFASVSGVLGAVQQFFFGNSTASKAANDRLDALAATAPVLALPASPLVLPADPARSTNSLNDASYEAARSTNR